MTLSYRMKLTDDDYYYCYFTAAHQQCGVFCSSVWWVTFAITVVADSRGKEMTKWDFGTHSPANANMSSFCLAQMKILIWCSQSLECGNKETVSSKSKINKMKGRTAAWWDLFAAILRECLFRWLEFENTTVKVAKKSHPRLQIKRTREEETNGRPAVLHEKCFPENKKSAA